MRPEALNFILCPNCAGELSLSGDASRAPEDGHIMTGTLACRGCPSQFSVRNGVPILLPANLASVKLETASRFAEEWTRWSDLRDYYEQEFFDWVAPIAAGDFANQIVFEGGCGKGRHTAIVASHGAKAIVALDLGESAFVAFAHTRQFSNAHVVIGDLLNPPVRPVFDLAFSVGVLHHLPDPAAGFASLASRVREGGRVAFWVYGHEGNEWISRGLRPSAAPQPPLPHSMQISKFAGDTRCAIARAADTIEVKSICILPFGSAGSRIRTGFASSNGATIRTAHCRTRQ